jgi:hypothetical protein
VGEDTEVLPRERGIAVFLPLGRRVDRLKPGLNWNAAFGNKSVVIPDNGRLPVKRLADGMSLTVLA